MQPAQIYLDYNATTPVDKRVLEVMLPYFTEKFGNASSSTHSFGWQAKEAVELARERVATLINTSPDQLIFTSGATEAINIALKGISERYQSKGNHIITCKTEHKAVLETCKSLEGKGFEVTYLNVDREGLIDFTELENAFRKETILVTIMSANNETGSLQDITRIGAMCRERQVLFMTDATQSLGKTRVDVEEQNIDILCCSAHKVYGPKGVGALYFRRRDPRVSLPAVVHGGGHEKGIRAGTLNVPGIAGFGKAAEIAMEDTWGDAARISGMRTFLEQQLSEITEVTINGSIRNRLPNTSNISFKNFTSEFILRNTRGIAVSTGSACTSAVMEPSHVLRAMGISDELAYASIRFSLGRFTSKEEIAESLKVFEKAFSSTTNP